MAGLGWSASLNVGDWSFKPNAQVGVRHALTNNVTTGNMYQANSNRQTISLGADRTYLNASGGFALSKGDMDFSIK